MLLRVISFFVSFFERLKPSGMELDIAKRFAGHPQSTAGPGRSSILIQCVQDPFYLGFFGTIVRNLRRECPAFDVDLYVLRGVRWGISRSLRQFVYAMAHQNAGVDRKWMKLY